MSTTNTELQKLEQEEQAIAARQQFMDTLNAKLEEAWQNAKSLPKEQRNATKSALMTVSNMIRDLIASNDEQNQLLQQAGALIDSQSAALTEMTKQREATLDEMSSLLKSIHNVDWNDKRLQKFFGETYQQLMEQHNANFWESLPYDMADVLGKEWAHMDADTLYSLITIDIDGEDDPEYYGWTRAQVIKARGLLLKIVRALDADGRASAGS